jgi:uncharacterized protein
MKVKIHEPSTWVPYRPSLCQGCYSGCCTLPVQVTSEELFHMGYIPMEKVNGPLKRIAQGLIKKGIIRSYNDRTRLFRLQQVNGNDCVFLDEKRLCKIYDRRPSICRQFPRNGKRPTHCPHQKNGTPGAGA